MDTSSRFLRARINESYRTLNKLKSDRQLQESELGKVLDTSIIESLETQRRIVMNNEKLKVKEIHKKKFDSLVQRSTRGHQRVKPPSATEEKWVINLSSKELNDSQVQVLKRGLKFAPTPKNIPVKEVVAEVESGLRRVPQQDADRVRISITGLLRKAVPPPEQHL